MNSNGSELADEDGPQAAWRRRVLGPGRATVLRQIGVRGGGSRQTPADEGEQRARNSRRNRERDRAVLRESCDMGTSGVRSSGLHDASARCLAVEPTADVRDRVLVEASVKTTGNVADMRRC
jgi:hypothetical protein